jgi:hypothetical protein
MGVDAGNISSNNNSNIKWQETCQYSNKQSSEDRNIAISRNVLHKYTSDNKHGPT